MRKIAVVLASLAFVGCSSGDHEDLRQWMNEATKDIRGRIPPLPQVKPYEPVPYDAGNLINPFSPTKIGAEQKKSGGGGLQPNMDRPREPLPRPPQASVAQPPLVRRAFSSHAPRALLIGSSTGGPQALMTLVGEIGAVIDRFPVLITQHMPPTFTTILAEHLARSSHRPAHEAVDGEIVKAGRIYLAPGGRHMRVVRRGTDVAIALDDGPPVNFCKPAVDPLFSSAIDVWQGGILAVVLTGMGSDGMRGGKEIVAAGGSVIAQDEATSVVWGMPGAAANAGICSAILPLVQIAPKLVRVFSGDRS